MSKNCYELKRYPYFLGTAPAEMNCPVFDNKSNCWEFNWLDFYQNIKDDDEKKIWKQEMIKFCKSCEIYKDHKEQLDKFFYNLE